MLTILLVALSTLYLDVFRNRLSKERTRQTRIEATTTAQALGHRAASANGRRCSPPSPRRPSSRMRLYGAGRATDRSTAGD